MKECHIRLLCCLKTLQSLGLTDSSFKTFNFEKQRNLPSSILKKKEISNLIKVAKCIIHIASMHANPLQITGEQVLLNKYLYRFRYFYKILEKEQLKYISQKHHNHSALEINTMALETLFLLAEY